jgi:hypothetical protein
MRMSHGAHIGHEETRQKPGRTLTASNRIEGITQKICGARYAVAVRALPAPNPTQFVQGLCSPPEDCRMCRILSIALSVRR